MPESFADKYCASHKHSLLLGGIPNFSTKQSLKVTFVAGICIGLNY